MKKILYLFFAVVLFSCGAEKEEKKESKDLAAEHSKNYCECIQSELTESGVDEDCLFEVISSFHNDLEKGNYSDEEADAVQKKYDDLINDCQEDVNQRKNEARISEIIDDAKSEYCDCMVAADGEESESLCEEDIRFMLKLELSVMTDVEVSDSNEVTSKQALSDEKQKELIAQVMSELDTACDN